MDCLYLESLILSFACLALLFWFLILQISVGGQTLEDYLMSFVQTSDSLAPVRDIAYSGVRRIHPNVQIKEAETRAPASVSPSKERQAPVFKIDLFGDILKTVLLQYQNVLKGALQSSETAEIIL